MQDIVDNNLSEIKLSAYVTTSYIHNMDSQETEWLTKAMIETGERIHFDTHPIMDKHSMAAFPEIRFRCSWCQSSLPRACSSPRPALVP